MCIRRLSSTCNLLSVIYELETMEIEVGEMDTSQGRMAEFLRASQSSVLDQWAQSVSAAVGNRVSAPELRRELEELYALVVRSIDSEDESAAGELRAVLAELSRSRARLGFSPSETAIGIFSLKDAVYSLVAESADLVPEYMRFARTIDDLGLHTFETFVAAREQIIADQAESMLELSTPVVRLWEGIIAVPLVGTLDSARTQMVMEKMLDALVTTEAEHAVIDITGVPTVDTEVAQHLLKTVVAARLMGAECIVTGIRPQIAHTIVSLGIEFGDVPTKQTLADGLAHALSRSGLKVVSA
jgi:rsbT co-antagonist protein RsbR